jgi:2-polyprenyl-3-methyl-5-hydroxy-6-metoxy-1,4-benzoquinol methylase
LISVCNICGGNGLERIPGYARLARVSSDCKPRPQGGELHICRRCGGVQKPATEAFLTEIGEIYGGYDVYYQGGGAEQISLDRRDGTLKRRSDLIVERLFAAASLKAPGATLDFGCGNGVMLRAIARREPGWVLDGLDLDDRYRSQLSNIAGFRKLVIAGQDEEAPETYDLVTMIHALEHLTDPLQSLKDIARRLKPQGLLFIESPNLADNPFDLLIADHATHFTMRSVAHLLHRAGFAVKLLATDWVAKELSVIAARDPAALATEASPQREENAVDDALAWLDAVARRARDHAAKGPLAVFGTSIAATWLTATIGVENVAFYVDEDSSRQGREHFGRRIVAPGEVPRGLPVFICLSPSLAANVAQRMSAAGLTCIV